MVRDLDFLIRAIRRRRSVLAVGLDTDPRKLPAAVGGDALAFNKAIIDATRDTCVAYKLNFAFYESWGIAGWACLEQTIRYIGDDHFIIADAKRGDIGNTSEMYARAIFDHLGCDAVTVSPYMGSDSVKPFMRPDRFVIVLALTSNTGSTDFQRTLLADGRTLFEQVLDVTSAWGTPENMMYVLGATHPDDLAAVRRRLPRHFFLVPGVGAQGGDLGAICRAGLTAEGGLLINASRSILYAGDREDFAEKAREEALRLQGEMALYLEEVC
jgi:orotidine-5'-phosphate decarboxylase